MSPADRQNRLVQELLRFEDPQERLAYVQDRVRRHAPFSPELRTEENRIQGCLTKVWLHARLVDGHCNFEVDSESSMVRGLASLIAETFARARAHEVLEFECQILELSQLKNRITPTRLHGLSQLERTIRGFAQACLDPGQP